MNYLFLNHTNIYGKNSGNIKRSFFCQSSLRFLNWLFFQIELDKLETLILSRDFEKLLSSIR